MSHSFSEITWHLIFSFYYSSAGKESACNAGDPSSISGSGSSPGEGIGYILQYSWVSLVAQTVKNLPAMWETWVRALVWEDPWRKAWQPTPVFPPGESPWIMEPGRLQSIGSQRVRHDWATKHSTHLFISSIHLPICHIGTCWIVSEWY